MENRMTVRVFCLLAALLGGCGDVGIFKAINAETPLKSNRTAPGNILSIVRYGTALYAAGGRIYRKENYTGKGDWSNNSNHKYKPTGLVVRLAAGYGKDGKEYLYALTAKTDNEKTTEYEVWYTSGEAEDWKNWKWVSMWKEECISTENPPAIFSNHAASVEKNLVYVTTSAEVFELNGGIVGDSVDANGASPSSVAAAYMPDGSTYFADTAAFASDGEHWFKMKRNNDGTPSSTISYGDTSLIKDTSIPGISNTIMSLWAHKTGENTGTLYIGMKYGGVKRAAYTVNKDNETDTWTLTFDEAEYLGGNAYAALGNYDIPAVFVTAGGEAVYASTVGITATQGTKKNGLWGYYPGVRETWDWE
jgi:hypothetical protein